MKIKLLLLFFTQPFLNSASANIYVEGGEEDRKLMEEIMKESELQFKIDEENRVQKRQLFERVQNHLTSLLSSVKRWQKSETLQSMQKVAKLFQAKRERQAKLEEEERKFAELKLEEQKQARRDNKQLKSQHTIESLDITYDENRVLQYEEVLKLQAKGREDRVAELKKQKLLIKDAPDFQFTAEEREKFGLDNVDNVIQNNEKKAVEDKKAREKLLNDAKFKEEYLFEKYLKERRVAGDGNCFFYTLAYQIQKKRSQHEHVPEYVMDSIGNDNCFWDDIEIQQTLHMSETNKGWVICDNNDKKLPMHHILRIYLAHTVEHWYSDSLMAHPEHLCDFEVALRGDVTTDKSISDMFKDIAQLKELGQYAVPVFDYLPYLFTKIFNIEVHKVQENSGTTIMERNDPKATFTVTLEKDHYNPTEDLSEWESLKMSQKEYVDAMKAMEKFYEQKDKNDEDKLD